MILTGKQIQKEIHSQSIVIEPFNPKHLGPNSYDVTLNPSLKIYDLAPGQPLDMRANNPTRSITIPESGYTLEPNVLYLGCTNETATSTKFVPLFEGRSSIGRLGINTHITAGFGDIGWGFIPDESGKLECQYPTWTLEIAVVHPVKIYPNIRIGQVYFILPTGEIEFYRGKYSAQREPQASKLYQDFANP